MKTRLREALPAALKHLIASALVALLASALVLLVWFPLPFDELLGGRHLFFLLISVDLVCGPLLTLIVFNRAKPKLELWRDIGSIVILQLCALVYGLWSIALVRPVYIAFEADRFRVVRLADVGPGKLDEAPEALRNIGLAGPRMIGVNVPKPGEPDFEDSVRLSLEDEYPAYRPALWVPIAEQNNVLIASLRPLSELRKRNPERQEVIERYLDRSAFQESQLGYLPMVVGEHDNWVLLLGRGSAEIVGYLPLSGW